jgi:hypothetical protein
MYDYLEAIRGTRPEGKPIEEELSKSSDVTVNVPEFRRVCTGDARNTRQVIARRSASNLVERTVVKRYGRQEISERAGSKHPYPQKNKTNPESGAALLYFAPRGAALLPLSISLVMIGLHWLPSF